jgi:hypothetical protein
MVDKTIEVGGIEFDAENLRDAVEAWDSHDNPAVYQDGIAVVDDGDDDTAFYLFHRDEGKAEMYVWLDAVLERVNEVTDQYDGLFIHAYDTDHWQVILPLEANYEIVQTPDDLYTIGYNPSDDVSGVDYHDGHAVDFERGPWDGHMCVEDISIIDEPDDV